MSNQPLVMKIKEDLKKSLQHLTYSFEKVKKFDLKKPSWSEDELETLESFSSRFARTTDLFTSRYLRSLALSHDPAFRGTVIDLLNLAEKLGVITSAKTWLRIRELRNVAAHDYAADDLPQLYRELFSLTPDVLQTLNRLSL